MSSAVTTRFRSEPSQAPSMGPATDIGVVTVAGCQ